MGYSNSKSVSTYAFGIPTNNSFQRRSTKQAPDKKSETDSS